MLPFPNPSSFNLTRCVNRHIFNSLSSPFPMWIPNSYSNCTWLYSRLALGTIAGLYLRDLCLYLCVLMCDHIHTHTYPHINFLHDWQINTCTSGDCPHVGFYLTISRSLLISVTLANTTWSCYSTFLSTIRLKGLSFIMFPLLQTFFNDSLFSSHKLKTFQYHFKKWNVITLLSHRLW